MEKNNLEWQTYETISYVAAIKLLLEENDLTFDLDKKDNAPTIMFDNECWQVLNIKATGDCDDWDAIRLQVVLKKGDEEKEATCSSENISQKDAFGLLCSVYAKTDDGEYEDLWEFLGYEIS